MFTNLYLTFGAQFSLLYIYIYSTLKKFNSSCTGKGPIH